MSIGWMRVLAVGLSMLVVGIAGAARADWRKAETAHFIVYGDTSERQIRAYAQRAERFDSLLRAYYPITVDHEIPKLEIFLAEGRRDMNKASPGIPAGVGGYYSPNSGRIHVVVNLQAISGDVVLFHEYAHHFMFQMRSNAYPSWFVEGFAEYYATAEIRPDRVQFGRHLPGRIDALNIGSNSWAKMEDVLTWRYSASGRYPAYLYYAQAWAMTHYFMSTPERTEMLGRYLQAVVGGQDSVAAMQAATGRTPEQLQGDVRRYVSGPIAVLTPQIEIPEPEVTVTSLTPAEGATAWLNLRLDRTPVIVEPVDHDDGPIRKTEAQKARDAREEAEERADLIRDALAEAGRHPGDRMGMLVTAKARRLLHEPDAALGALEPLLSDSSTDAEALRVAAFALLDKAGAEGDADEALVLRRRASGYLARSMDADPLDFRTYLGLNDTRRTQASYPTDNDISTLEVSVALAPQSFDARMRLGQAYVARQLHAEAVTVLMPVANSPHRSSWTRRARELITTARTAMGQTTETWDSPPGEEVEEEPGDAAPASAD